MSHYIVHSLSDCIGKNEAITGEELVSRLEVDVEDREKVIHLWARSILSGLPMGTISECSLVVDFNTGQRHLQPSFEERFLLYTIMSNSMEAIMDKLPSLDACYTADMHNRPNGISSGSLFDQAVLERKKFEVYILKKYAPLD